MRIHLTTVSRLARAIGRAVPDLNDRSTADQPAPIPASSPPTPREQPSPPRPKRTRRAATPAETGTVGGVQSPASTVSAEGGPTGDSPPTAEPEPIPVVDGIAVVYGYGVKLRVERGHLFISDGICADRRAAYLNRATSGLRHLVILGHTGVISVDAFKWLHALGASVSMIDADGEVIFASSRLGADEAHLRRAQGLAAFTDVGLDVMRSLLIRKIRGQARNLGALGNDELAAHLGAAVDTLEGTTTVEELMPIEAYVANRYWEAWEHLPITFARKDQARVPEHWRSFGQRKGQAGSSPRNATTPANAVLNYLYAILETEARVALLTLGLDPGLGLLHADKRDRDSLALDVMEAVRPDVDAWLLDFLRGRAFARSNFAELPDGVVRITANLARELCQTAPLWRKLIAPIVEQAAQQIVRVTKPDAKVPTRLTNAKRTNATRARTLASEQTAAPAEPNPLVAPEPQPPSPRKAASPRRAAGVARNCPECGKRLVASSRATFCSPECSATHNREVFLVAATAAAQSPEAKQKRSGSSAARKAETLAWEQAHPEVDLAGERARFCREILPRLSTLTMHQTADALGCSLSFVKQMRKGDGQPHPMRFAALEALLSAKETQAPRNERLVELLAADGND